MVLCCCFRYVVSVVSFVEGINVFLVSFGEGRYVILREMW